MLDNKYLSFPISKIGKDAASKNHKISKIYRFLYQWQNRACFNL